MSMKDVMAEIRQQARVSSAREKIAETSLLDQFTPGQMDEWASQLESQSDRTDAVKGIMAMREKTASLRNSPDALAQQETALKAASFAKAAREQGFIVTPQGLDPSPALFREGGELSVTKLADQASSVCAQLIVQALSAGRGK